MDEFAKEVVELEKARALSKIGEKKHTWIWIVLILLLLAAGGYFAYRYFRLKSDLDWEDWDDLDDDEFEELEDLDEEDEEED